MRSLLLAGSLLACGSYASKTAYFSLTLTWEPAAPDGFTKDVTKVNGQFPGPGLVVDQGDDVEILVWNNLPNETSLHFTIGTLWSDGVTGLSQRAIPAGETFLYKWNANAYGSNFYHAHEQSQIADGLFGPIYVRPLPGSDSPFSRSEVAELAAIEKAKSNTRPILFNTWSHLTSAERSQVAVDTGLDTFCSNSCLINGKGSAICLPAAEINDSVNPALVPLLGGMSYSDIGCLPVPLASGGFPFNVSGLPDGVFAGCRPSTGGQEVITVNPADKYARFDLIAVGQLSTFFSIDEHELAVVAIDGRWVTPTPAHVIQMSSVQRYSVVVKLDKTPARYTIRSISANIAQIIGATGPLVTLGGTNATADTVFLNESQATPWPPVALSQKIDETFLLDINNNGKSWKWLQGNTSFPISLDNVTPLLFNPSSLSSSGGDLTLTNRNGTWVDLVIQPLPAISPAHPMHKHSNKFFVIGAGIGVWNYSSVAEAEKVLPDGTFKFVDPPIRDTYPTLATMGEPGWLALRYQSVNPGEFWFHCHIQDHLFGRMAIALLDGVDKFPKVPDEYLFWNGFRGCGATPGGK